MPPLKNPKHEIFAQALFTGMSQADAIKKAGYNYISSQRNGGGQASRLAHNVTIEARVTELQEQVATQVVEAAVERSVKVMNRDEKLERLSAIAREDVEGRYSLIREPNISAIKVLNDMTGDNAPQKGEMPKLVQTFVFIMPDGTRVLPGSFKPKEVIDVSEGE